MIKISSYLKRIYIILKDKISPSWGGFFLSFMLATVLVWVLFANYKFLYFNWFPSCEVKLREYEENKACILTRYGIILVELYTDAAPNSVDRFRYLANEVKFYDGLEFYRVVKDFVVQGGIQDFYIKRSNMIIEDNRYKGKVDIFINQKIDLEVNFDVLNISEEEKVRLSSIGIRTNPSLNTRLFKYGSLGFANKGESDPNSASTEFFIVTGQESQGNVQSLNGKFTNFGQVIEGFEVLQLINNSKIDESYKYSTEKSKPLEIIDILEIRVK